MRGGNDANSVASSSHALTVEPNVSEDSDDDSNPFADALNGDESDDMDDNEHHIIHVEDDFTTEDENPNAAALEGVDEACGTSKGVRADGAIKGMGVEGPLPTQ